MAERQRRTPSFGRLCRGNAVQASRKPTLVDLGWAAGFLEGEGTFNVNRTGLGRSASSKVSATQKQKEPLEVLQALFGGSIIPFRSKYWRWTVYGSRARGLMFTMFSFLSRRRREQARTALGYTAIGNMEIQIG
jgi:hypothetical protein